MLKTFALIMIYSIMINWMISLSMVAQISEDKKNRLRFFSLSFASGLLTGYIIYLL